jgi:hypothetical protein
VLLFIFGGVQFFTLLDNETVPESGQVFAIVVAYTVFMSRILEFNAKQ